MSLAIRRTPAILAVLLLAAFATMLYGRTNSADGLVVDPLDASFDQSIYGDFITLGNTNMQCPESGDPQFNATCLTDATSTSQTVAANDSYYMRYHNSDISGAVDNSSSAAFTVPAGATIELAKIYWSGNTGEADLSGTPFVACNASQVNAGAPPALLPTFGAQNQIQLAIDGGGYSTITGTTQIEPTAGTGGRVYVSEADITANIAALSTGVSHTITGADIWTPEGNNCTGGWSVVIVWSFATPNPSAPELRHIGLYDGFVRQRATDPNTPTQISGFISRLGTLDPRLSVVAYEGDQGIINDQFLVNSTAIEEARITPAATTNNFFASTADGGVSPSAQNKWGIDAKTVTLDPSLVPAGSTTVDLEFTTNGDTYYPQVLAFSLTVEADNGGISGVVYQDDDGSTTLNGGESGINGVTVSLTGTDNEGGTVNLSTVTSGGGAYSFPNLLPSDGSGYTITETQPANYGSTTPNTITAVLGINEVLTDQNFGDNLATISGTVWHDADESTTINGGELGIGGVTVTLTGTSIFAAPVNLSTVTASDGTYSFDGLDPADAGGYTVTETQPSGYASTTPNSVGSISLAAGSSASGIDFGEDLASLAGTVGEDTTGDGASNGPIAGVTITVTGNDIDANPISRSTVSAGDGSWIIDDLPASDGTGYTVTESQPSSHLDDDEVAGTAGGTNSADDVISGIVLGAGVEATGYDFLEIPPATISGSVLADDDGDGSGDTPIASVDVTLTGTDDRGAAVSVTVQTNASGAYSFTNLRPSDGTGYTVTETQPSSHLDGPDTVGSLGGTGSDDVASSIIVTPGATGTGYDFLEYAPATVSGVVYDDVDASTTFNGGDAGIDGVTVTLTGTDISGNSLSRSTTTVGGGTYSFIAVPPSDPTGYTITETQPAGYGNTTPDTITGVTVAPGAAITDQNFGDITGALTGVVFDDWNMNGVQDAGEPGIDGVTITLTGTDNTLSPVAQSVTTSGGGLWSFLGLPPSDAVGYTVTESQPAGYLDFDETLGSLGGTIGSDTISGIVMTAGASGTGYDFAEVSPASVAGTVFEDDNGNAIPDGLEVGINGVTVTLTGTDLAGDPVSRTETTSGGGGYVFAGLYPSDGTGYTVAETQPTSHLDGLDAAGTAGGSAGNDITSGVVLSAGTDATGYRFGEFRPASIAGVVYAETDDDGVQEAGESGIAGVAISITGTDLAGNAVSRPATTDGSGAWSVTDLPPSNVAGYTVTETQPSSHFDGIDTAGSAGGVVGSDTIGAVVLPAGTDATGYVFAEITPASISGTVFHDIDEDGVFDLGEPGIGGVTITLVDAGLAETQVLSAPDGTYSFTGLPAGDYSIIETQPAQWDSTTPDQLDVTLPATGLTDQNFGEAEETAVISDLVWDDLDADGVVDPGEPGIPGVTVLVLDEVGTQIGTATTAADGTYSIVVPPDSYLVTLDASTVPADYTATTSGTVEVAPGPGEVLDTVDFGLVETGSISGSVWNDEDADGAIDEGELPEGQVTVVLVDVLGVVVAQTLTNPDGSYVFTDVLPGTYTIEFTTPDGKAFTPEGLVDPETGVIAVEVLSGAETGDVDAGLVVGGGSLAFSGSDLARTLSIWALLFVGIGILVLSIAIDRRRWSNGTA